MGDILKMPALSGAKLLTKVSGNSKIVSSMSVLEYANISKTQEHITDRIRFWGNELIITSFANVANDVDLQCKNIKRYAMLHEVGFVLFYVGIFMPKVDQKLIDLANKLDFVLILMPENDPSLSYSSVITEVLDATFRDKMKNPVFAIDLLDQISKMDGQLQNMTTVLRLLSNRIHASIAVVDPSGNLIQSANWPRNKTIPWDTITGPNYESTAGGMATKFGELYVEEVKLGNHNSKFSIKLLAETSQVDVYSRAQIVEAIQIGQNLWGIGESSSALQVALLTAIFEDEFAEINRLSSQLHIDVSSIRSIWAFPVVSGIESTELRMKIVHSFNKYSSVKVADFFHSVLFVLIDRSIRISDLDNLLTELQAIIEQNGIDSVPIEIHDFNSIHQIMHLMSLVINTNTSARIIFPKTKHLTRADLELAMRIQDVVDQGMMLADKFVTDRIGELRQHKSTELIKTLQSYLLDNDLDMRETAKELFVHLNTVKYRINNASDALGYKIGKFPDTYDLIQALSVLRLVSININ